MNCSLAMRMRRAASCCRAARSGCPHAWSRVGVFESESAGVRRFNVRRRGRAGAAA